MLYERFTSQVRNLESKDDRCLAVEREVVPSMRIVRAGYLASEKACRRMRAALLKLILADTISDNIDGGLINNPSRIQEVIPMAASLLARPAIQDKVVGILALEYADPPLVIWEHFLLNSVCRELSTSGSSDGARIMLGYLARSMPRTESLIEAVVPEALSLLRKGGPQTIVPCYVFLGSLTDYKSQFLRVSFAKAIHAIEDDMDLIESGSLSWKLIQGSVFFATRLLSTDYYSQLVTDTYLMKLLNVWDNITEGSWPRSFDFYHGVLNPFLQLAVIKLLGSQISRLPSEAIATFQKIIWRYLRAPRMQVTEGPDNSPDEHYSNIRAGMLIECSMTVILNRCLHTPELLEDVFPRIFHLVASPGGKRSLMIGFNRLADVLQSSPDLSVYLPKLRPTITPIISNLANGSDNTVAHAGCRLALALMETNMLNPQVVVLAVTQCIDRFSFDYETKTKFLMEAVDLLRTRLASNPETTTMMIFFVINKMGFLSLSWMRETAGFCYREYGCDPAKTPGILTLFGRALHQYHSYNVLLIVLLTVSEMLYSSIDIFLTSTAAYISLDNLRNVFQQIAVTYTDTHMGRQAIIRDGYATLCLVILALNSASLEPIETLVQSLGLHTSSTQQTTLKKLLSESRTAEDALSMLRNDVLLSVDKAFTLESNGWLIN